MQSGRPLLGKFGTLAGNKTRAAVIKGYVGHFLTTRNASLRVKTITPGTLTATVKISNACGNMNYAPLRLRLLLAL
jgi:hypothetical protein